MSTLVILYLSHHCFLGEDNRFSPSTGPQMERNCAPGWILLRTGLTADVNVVDDEIWDSYAAKI